MIDRTAAEQAAEALRKSDDVLERYVDEFVAGDTLLNARKAIAEALAALTAESARAEPRFEVRQDDAGKFIAQQVDGPARVSPDREALARRLAEQGRLAQQTLGETWSPLAMHDFDATITDAYAFVTSPITETELTKRARNWSKVSSLPEDLRSFLKSVAAVALRLPAQAEADVAWLIEKAGRWLSPDTVVPVDVSTVTQMTHWISKACRCLSSLPPAAGEWRPIATVPDDGSPVWVGWNKPDRKPRVERRVADGGARWRNIKSGKAHDGPSHWMPAAAPAPPQETAE